MTKKFPTRSGRVQWMSCPICSKHLAGTDDYDKIPSFCKDKDFEEHLAKHSEASKKASASSFQEDEETDEFELINECREARESQRG